MRSKTTEFWLRFISVSRTYFRDQPILACKFLYMALCLRACCAPPIQSKVGWPNVSNIEQHNSSDTHNINDLNIAVIARDSSISSIFDHNSFTMPTCWEDNPILLLPLPETALPWKKLYWFFVYIATSPDFHLGVTLVAVAPYEHLVEHNRITDLG